MTREIKFRAKRKDNGEWVYGNLIIGHNTASICSVTEKGVSMMDVDPSTIGQYTGLKDKNGKEIYEGDIAEDCSHSGLVFRVQWDSERAGYYMPEIFDEEYHVSLSEVELEIIGNFHDNPTLTKL